MSTLSPKEVGDLMTIYAARPCPVADAFPRYTNAGINLFDRGHYRKCDVTQVGQRTVMRKTINFVQTSQGVAPEGFVPVPERVILKHFMTDVLVNADKIENAIVEYRRAFGAWTDGPRPRRPTLRMLRLRRGSEFENFLRPLISPYVQRLKENFDYLLDQCEQGNVFTQVNNLYLPSTVPETDANGNDVYVNGVLQTRRTDTAFEQRWASAVNGGDHNYIFVRMANFAALGSEPSAAELPPILIPPFGNPPGNEPDPPDRPNTPPPSDLDKDELLLGKGVSMGGAFKHDFLGMVPWHSATRKRNPFKSAEYRAAWDLVQDEFYERYEAFKRGIDQRRGDHAQKWSAYKQYKEAMEAYHYTRQLNVPFAERPQVVDFGLEWKKFIFGLREEMKHVQFFPVVEENAVPEFLEVDSEDEVDGLMLRPRMLMI